MYILISILLLMISSTAFSSWHIENLDIPGINPSLALNSTGYPCIAYPVDGTGVKYAEWDGNQWNIETAFSYPSSSNLYYVSLDLDSLDSPHICFPFIGLRYVTKDGSMQWQYEDIPMIDDTRNTVMALDDYDKPHVFCRVDGQYIGYVTRPDTAWNVDYLDSSYNTGWYLSMALDSDNLPHIAFGRKNPDVLMYGFPDSSGLWSFQAIDSVPEAVINTSIALSTDDIPHISYNVENEVRYTYWTGSDWHIETIDVYDSGSFGYGTSIALDSSNYPHISYCSWADHCLMYTSWTGSEWQYEVVDTLPDYYFQRGDPDLLLDVLNRPHIAYWAGYPDNDLRYAWDDFSGISEDENISSNLRFGVIYPNPSDGMASIQFTLEAESNVDITIYDITGRTVSHPVSGEFAEGTHCIAISVSSPGIYFARLSSGYQIDTVRFAVLE